MSAIQPEQVPGSSEPSPISEPSKTVQAAAGKPKDSPMLPKRQARMALGAIAAESEDKKRTAVTPPPPELNCSVDSTAQPEIDSKTDNKSEHKKPSILSNRRFSGADKPGSVTFSDDLVEHKSASEEQPAAAAREEEATRPNENVMAEVVGLQKSSTDSAFDSGFVYV